MGKGSQDLAQVCWGGGSSSPGRWQSTRVFFFKKGWLWGPGTYIALGGYSLQAGEEEEEQGSMKTTIRSHIVVVGLGFPMYCKVRPKCVLSPHPRISKSTHSTDLVLQHKSQIPATV